MDSLEEMSAVAEARGDSGGIFKEFAKTLKDQKKKATASPKDRREFGLDRLAWDLMDLAVKDAERRGCAFMTTEIQDAKIRRERLMWDLIEGTSMDAASITSGRTFLNEADCSRMSRRFREDKMYIIF